MYTMSFVHIIAGFIVLWVLFSAILAAIGVGIIALLKTPAMGRWWWRKMGDGAQMRRDRQSAREAEAWQRYYARQERREQVRREHEFWHGKR